MADSAAYLEQLPDGVVVVDADGRITYANPAAERLAGAGRDELVGRALLTTPCPARRRRQPLVDVLERLRRLPGVAAGPGARAPPGRRRRARPGRPSPPLSCATAPAGSSRQGVLRDASARNRDSQRGELISTLAHELRSPDQRQGLHSTLLHCWERFTDDQKREMLATVNMDADRVTRLIRELLDVSRIDAKPPGAQGVRPGRHGRGHRRPLRAPARRPQVPARSEWVPARLC